MAAVVPVVLVLRGGAEELEIEKLLALTRGYFYLVQKQVVDLVSLSPPPKTLP